MRRKKDKSNGITALYERLSRDDDNAGESKGKTNYKVKVFFDHSSGLTAEDRLKRIIQAEAERESA